MSLFAPKMIPVELLDSQSVRLSTSLVSSSTLLTWISFSANCVDLDRVLAWEAVKARELVSY